MTARAIFMAGLVLVQLLGCAGLSGCRGPRTVVVRGVGASFPDPIYRKWVDEFDTIKPSVRIDYQAQDSGAGIRAIKDHTADFGASDVPLDEADARETGGEVLHLPTVIGGVVLTYNLPGVAGALRFTPAVIAGIFLGEITRWDDPRLAADNPGVALPTSEIIVVFRAESSGTSQVFSGYLTQVDERWRARMGQSKLPNWRPGLGIGAKGNEGVTGVVKNTPYTIGYVEDIFARQAGLPVGSIRNQAGKFVEPTIASLTAAAEAALARTPDELNGSITNAGGDESYPIASYTYVLLFREQADAAKARALVDFFWWALHDGIGLASAMEYAPPPPAVIRRVEVLLDSITSNGKPVAAQNGQTLH